MEARRIALLDDDLRYVTKLAAYMNQKSRFLLEAFPFSEAERLRSYLDRHPMQALLVSEKKVDDCREFLSLFSEVFILTGKRIPAGAADGEFPGLYRYRPADELLRELWQLMNLNSQPGRNRVKRIGYYSPVKRCGKTSLAIAMGFHLAQNERVLYLNLEEYHGFRDLGVTDVCGKDLSDLLYFFRTNPQEEPLPVEEYVSCWEDLEYIMPGRPASYVKELTGTEWIRFLDALDRRGIYDTVLLDIGAVSEDLFILLSGCGKVYVPGRKDTVSEAKLAQFLEEAQILGGDGFEKKLCMVLVPEADFENAGFPWALTRGDVARFSARLAQEAVHD